MFYIFKITFQTGDINVFVHHGVISVLLFQIKSSFSGKRKHPRWNLRHTVVKKLLKFYMTKYLKKILLLTELGILQKLFALKNGTGISDRNILSTI